MKIVKALSLYQQLADEGYAVAVQRLIKAHQSGELGLAADPDKIAAMAELIK